MKINPPPPNAWIVWLATAIAISSLGISFDDSFAQTITITPTDSIDDMDDNTLELDGALGITSFVIDAKTYVVVTGNADDGVQILEVTDPENITATDFFDDGTDSDILLDEVTGITSFVIDNNTYVATAANEDDGMQILNVTNPTTIIETISIKDGDNSDYQLEGSSGITSFVIGAKTYVAVAGFADAGVQIFDVTDLGNITGPDNIEDNSNRELLGANKITSFVIGIKTYVAVTGYTDDGVQILEVTDPENITATDSIDDMDNSVLELDGAQGITSFVISGKTYVAVAGYDDDGVQILEISSQGNITARDSIDDMDNSVLELDGAAGITSFVIGAKTYVAVAGKDDDGVQILDVSDPANITASASMGDTASLELDGVNGITSFVISGKTHLAVAGEDDDGVQILKLNQAPTANAGSNQSVVAGTLVTLSGSGSDSDGDTISYSWAKTSGPAVTLSSNTSQNPTFTAPSSAGTITFTLTVSDDTLSDTDTVTITISTNQPPTANAGSNQSVAVGASVTLDGTGSTDPDSNTLTYLWAKTSGPSISLNGAMTAQPTFTAPPSPSTIIFTLSVTDELTTVTDTVTITVSTGLIANAGQDQNVTTGDVVTLDGTNSANTAGNTLTYSWAKTSGPAVTLNGAMTAQPTFTAPSSPGSIIFTLTVSDGTSEKTDTVTITVSAPPQNPNPIPNPNQSPTANAGRDRTFPPESTVTLSGSGTDPNGDSLTYTWSQTSGTPRVTINDNMSARTTFTAPSDPTKLVFTLRVYDGTYSDTDDITITIARQTKNIQNFEDVVVLAQITAPNEITMIYNEELSTFINSYLNFTITGESTPRHITGIDGSPSKSMVVNIDGNDTNAFVTILTFDGKPAPSGSTGTMYMQHSDYYLELIKVSDGQN